MENLPDALQKRSVNDFGRCVRCLATLEQASYQVLWLCSLETLAGKMLSKNGCCLLIKTSKKLYKDQQKGFQSFWCQNSYFTIHFIYIALK